MVAVLVIEKDLFILYVPRLRPPKNGIVTWKPAHWPKSVQTSFTLFTFTAMRMNRADVPKDTPTVRPVSRKVGQDFRWVGW
jgi:hypothetical protein